MGSKFFDVSDFEKFREELKNETNNEAAASATSYAKKWPVKNLKGTLERPNVYEIRFLPEKSKSFFKRVYYHMVQSGEKWHYMLCEKTFDPNNYCPLCAASMKLFNGNADDKKEASKWRRKEKFVANILVIDDPRDAQIEEDEKKSTGKVMLYEFPGQVEKFLREEINDTRRGVGMGAFDPSEEGYNFVLKVGAKPAPGGKTWPDYNLTAARKPSAIADSDKGIKALLEATYDLKEYMEKSRAKEDDMINLLKNELLYDLIATEYEKRKGVENAAPLNESHPEKNEAPKSTRSSKVIEPEEDSEEDTDLLEQLNNLGK